MSRRLPSLNGLRAFEAAARHGSFVGASAELNVTQAAVSRMVRLLEARLAFPLFERRPNGLALTPQGKALQPGLTAAFDADCGHHRAGGRDAQHADADPRRRALVRDALADPAPRDVLSPAPGNRGAPRDRRRTNPYKDDWTCGILLGNGDWPGYEAEPMFSADLFPVCTAAIAQRLATTCGSRRTACYRSSIRPRNGRCGSRPPG